MSSSSESWIVQAWADGQDASSEHERAKPVTRHDADQLLLTEFILRTVLELQQCDDAPQACQTLANRLRQFLGCRQVAVGLCQGRRRRCVVRGLSGVCRVDSNTHFVRAVRDALEETLVRATETAWPPTDTSDKHGTMAHEQLVTLLGADCVASVPLHGSDGDMIGVVLLIDEPAESAFQLLRQHGPALAACMELLEHEHAPAVIRKLRRWTTARTTWRTRFMWVAAACLALALTIPWPYHVACHSQLQPVTRRFVVAPYDGTLESSMTAPGDVVHQDQVLARMDQREIRWELAGLDAELARAAKERDAAMAVHHASSAQLAKLEIERLELQKQLLEHRARNLAIKSPIDGIVVAGDLEKAQGAPLTIGQTLFEIAPLDRMVVEVEIPEEEIAYVRTGMNVEVRLDAFPDQPFSGVIQRIHPKAELRDHKSVFIAEVDMENQENRLRPGMNGRASIASGRRNLGWILFHKPWTSVRRALAW